MPDLHKLFSNPGSAGQHITGVPFPPPPALTKRQVEDYQTLGEVDDHLTRLEIHLWVGFGALVILQAVTLIFMLICVYQIHMIVTGGTQ